MSTVSLSTRWDFQFRGSMVMRTCFGHFYTTSRMATSLRVPPPRIGGCNGQSSRPSRHRRTEVDARLTTTRRPERGTGGNVSIRLHLSLRRAVKIRSLELLLRHQMVRHPRTPIVEALFLAQGEDSIAFSSGGFRQVRSEDAASTAASARDVVLKHHQQQ